MVETSDEKKKPTVAPADSTARDAAARAYASEHGAAEEEPPTVEEDGEACAPSEPVDLEAAERDASALVRVALLGVAVVRAKRSPASAVVMARGAAGRAASIGARLAPRWAGQAWLGWAGLTAEFLEDFLQERIDAAKAEHAERGRVINVG